MGKRTKFPPDSPRARAETVKVRIGPEGRVIVDGVPAPFRVDAEGECITFVDRNRWRCEERREGERVVSVPLEVLVRAVRTEQEVRREHKLDDRSLVHGPDVKV